MSSQQASGERHVSKKSFPDRNSRNSGDEIDEMTIQRDFNHNQLSSYEGKRKKNTGIAFSGKDTCISKREKKMHLSPYLVGIVRPVSYTTQGHAGFLLPVLLAGMYRSGAAGSL